MAQTATNAHDQTMIIQTSDGTTLLMWPLITPFPAQRKKRGCVTTVTFVRSVSHPASWETPTNHLWILSLTLSLWLPWKNSSLTTTPHHGGPESWYHWYRRYQKNILTYYCKSDEILSYSDKLDIWIFNKWYKHFVQQILDTLSNEYWILCILNWKLRPLCRGFNNITYALRLDK